MPSGEPSDTIVRASRSHAFFSGALLTIMAAVMLLGAIENLVRGHGLHDPMEVFGMLALALVPGFPALVCWRNAANPQTLKIETSGISYWRFGLYNHWDWNEIQDIQVARVGQLLGTTTVNLKLNGGPPNTKPVLIAGHWNRSADYIKTLIEATKPQHHAL